MVRSFVATAALLAASTALARPSLPGDGMRRLAHYEVLTFTDPGGNGINKGKAIALVDATPDELFRVTTDFARYPEFAPRVVSAKVVDRQEHRAQVILQSDLPWPVSKAWVYAQYEMDRLGPDTYRVRFYQLRGTLKRYFGSIYIEPWQKWKGGGTSTITYELLAEPDSSAPKRLINNQVEAAVGKYIHALRQRVNDLRRQGRLHPELPPSAPVASPLVGPKSPRRFGDVAEAH